VKNLGDFKVQKMLNIINYYFLIALLLYRQQRERERAIRVKCSTF